MISNRKISTRTSKKRNPEVVATIRVAKSLKPWNKIAQILSRGKKTYVSLNLNEIDEMSKAGDTVVVPGKVLGSGKLTKKITVCALMFSSSAVEKLSKSGGRMTILEEIKQNPKATGIKILS